MKKIILKVMLAVSLATVASSASALKLYQDENGQVFTKAGEGRTLLTKKSVSVYSKADKLKFSGLTYLGVNTKNYSDNQDTTAQMEIRRAYFQLKAYLLEDSKSYYRVTFDMSKDVTGDEKLRAKYAYLYLNDIAPATGMEFGLVHRPWHDYEEHNAWYYRNISKVLIEDKDHGADLSNSADFGVLFKTKTKYFDADYGIFNGEGYHAAQNPQAPSSLSFEWRTTVHILGVKGKEKQTKKTYFDVSFFGQYNKKHRNVTVGSVQEEQDLIFGGLHTVYNVPSFLIAAQYVQSQNTSNLTNNVSDKAGSGYSANAEYRLGSDKEYRILARYDSWTFDNVKKENKGYIFGAAWEMNKNVQWVANTIVTNNEQGSNQYANNGTAYMITAEVRF